ncbi:MAG: hypothetical protein KGY50_01420 [Candidatus Thermoplasmatota archaeon]|nr:hypothetical protein [Candidatus Thermoplasmatota archaeon]
MKIKLSVITQIRRKIPIKYITLILAIIGVIFLYTLSLFQQPITINSLQSLENYEGKEVTINGTIMDYSITSYGSQLITIQSNSTQLTIFSDTPIQCHSGDNIQATGTIQEYKDTWELILSNPKAATITETWQNNTTQLKHIASHPKDYLNIPLNITGYIDIIYDNIIYLKDNISNHTIPLIPPTTSTPQTGTEVFVHATLAYDPTHLRYILTDCKTLKQITDQNTID